MSDYTKVITGKNMKCCTQKCRIFKKVQLLHGQQNVNYKITFLWYIFWQFYCYNQKMPGEGHLELFLSFQYFNTLVVKRVHIRLVNGRSFFLTGQNGRSKFLTGQTVGQTVKKAIFKMQDFVKKMLDFDDSWQPVKNSHFLRHQFSIINRKFSFWKNFTENIHIFMDFS